MQRKFCVVSDQHFLNNWENIQPFCDLVESLRAEDYYLILLGDLFHYWFGVLKKLTNEQKKLLQFFQDFQKKGGKIALLIGNRDILFSENHSFLFFDYCSFKELTFNTKKNKKITFTHGNLINRKDKLYFLWRKIAHSWLMKFFIFVIPKFYFKRITDILERKLKKSNKKAKIFFPQEEWEYFLSQHQDSDICVVGHFHPLELIEKKHGNTKGLVLEAWADKPAYLLIDENLQISHLLWQGR